MKFTGILALFLALMLSIGNAVAVPAGKVEFAGGDKGKVTFECSYNTDLLDAQTVHRRMAEFERMLAGIAANPAQPIGDLPLLPEDEERRLLSDWNATDADYPTRSWSSRRPGRPARWRWRPTAGGSRTASWTSAPTRWRAWFGGTARNRTAAWRSACPARSRW